MLSTLTKLLMHRQMQFGDGKIEIFGQPVVLNALHTELGILRELEKQKMEHVIYYSAKNAGYLWFEGMTSKYGLKIGEIMNWGPELINLAGWGVVKPVKADVKGSEFSFLLLQSTMAKYYGKTNHPVDHYFRGLVTGAWEYACKQKLEGIEVECMATGANACRFELKTKNKLDLANANVKRQLGLK
ncbi:MAG: 4-vinyl reductase [Candidatus Micrarchaeota archaeon]